MLARSAFAWASADSALRAAISASVVSRVAIRSGLELVAAPHVFVRHPRDLDRRDVDVLALDIADGGVERRRAGGQDSCDQRDGADRFEDHGAVFRARAMAASRLATTRRLIAAASAGPMSAHSMRRSTAGRAMRK